MHAEFRLDAPPVTNLTRLDLSDGENVKDAAHQLRRCATPADYQRWAQTWGHQLCQAAEIAATYDSDDFISREEFTDIEEDCSRAEKSVTDLQTAMERAETALERLTEDHDLGPKAMRAVDVIINALEAARTKA
jgi:hypothetical protein